MKMTLRDLIERIMQSDRVDWDSVLVTMDGEEIDHVDFGYDDDHDGPVLWLFKCDDDEDDDAEDGD